MAGGNVRRKRTANYTIIGNEPMDDDVLNAESLGVLCYVRSRPDNWHTHPKQLAKRFACGRDRIYRILTDLIDAGYVERARQRIVGGQWGPVEYIFYDDPVEPRPENTEVAPDPENPYPEKPRPENPDTENTHALLKTDSLPRTDNNKKLTLTNDEIDLAFEHRLWPAYPKRSGQRGKPEAKKKFRTIVKSGGNIEKIIDAATKLASDWEPRISRKPIDAQFIPMAATWLNKLRWDDEEGGTPEGGETMFDLAKDFENRVRESNHEHRVDDDPGDRPIDG